jgi:hypothetical protein
VVDRPVYRPVYDAVFHEQANDVAFPPSLGECRVSQRTTPINVNLVYTWVQLARCVPVRIRITNVPAGIPAVSGMTTTVTIRAAEVSRDV